MWCGGVNSLEGKPTGDRWRLQSFVHSKSKYLGFLWETWMITMLTVILHDPRLTDRRGTRIYVYVHTLTCTVQMLCKLVDRWCIFEERLWKLKMYAHLQSPWVAQRFSVNFLSEPVYWKELFINSKPGRPIICYHWRLTSFKSQMLQRGTEVLWKTHFSQL